MQWVFVLIFTALQSCLSYADVDQATRIAGTKPGMPVHYTSGRLVLEDRSGRLVPRQLKEKSTHSKQKQRTNILKRIPVMVRIPGKNYEMGKFEVTQAEWQAVMGSNPSHFSHCGGNCPVESMSWIDINEFIRKLNARTGSRYRLPTEREWEYACYGGKQTEYCGNNLLGVVGWFDGNSDSRTHAVGQKHANGYGLYDMSGNVWEITSTCDDPDCTKRVLRGDSWNSLGMSARVDIRNNFGSRHVYDDIGFRLARTLQQ